MKYIFTAFSILSIYSLVLSQTLYNLSLTGPASSANFVDVEINLSFDVTNGLGTSNFFINYDQSKLAQPTILNSVFSSPYLVTITHPAIGLTSFNLELPPGQTGVTITNTLTQIAVLRFAILSGAPNGPTMITHNPSTEVFTDDDNILPAGTITNYDVALPIDIKTFSATKDGDRNARLDWSTSLEINSAYFGIERSIDGTSWEGISKVAAAGNSNTEQLYTYTDRDLPLNRSKDQIFYYRLQLVDLDGQYKYSDIRGVNFGKENTNKVISLYPNPAVQMVNLDLSGMDLESGAIHLRVTDMQGRNMIDKTILGNGIEPIEVTQLPAGTYNVAVSQGANLYQKQFIKIE